MESDTAGAIPVRIDAFVNLHVQADDVLKLFNEVESQKSMESCLPPVLPLEGHVYVFNLGTDSEKNKKKFRLEHSTF